MAQKWTFEAVSEPEMALKHILDHSRVIPTQFPHEKHIFYMKIDAKSSKIEKMVQKIKFFAPAWGLVEDV